MIRINLAIGLLFLAFAPVKAQTDSLPQAPGKNWTLQECIDYGVERSFEMARQKLANRQDNMNLRDAYLNLLPDIDAGTSLNYSFGRGIDPNTNTYVNQRNMSNNYSVGASMGLFSGFTTINNIRYNRVSKLKGLEDSEKLANDIAVRIMQAFYDVAYAEGLIKIAEEQFDNAKMQLKRMERQHELGIKPKSDLFDIQAQLAESEYKMISSRNTRETNLIILKQLMNYPASEELGIDVNSLAGSIPAYSELNPNEVFIKAKEDLPQMLAAEHSMRAAKLNLYVKKGQLLPSLSASGSFDTRYIENAESVFHSQIVDNLGKGFGLSLNIPIFYGLRRQSAVSKAKYDYQTAQIQYQEMEQSVYKEVQLALQDLKAASQEFTMALKKENFSALSYTANEKKYAQGLVSIIDLNTSDNNWMQAKHDVLKARLTYAIKKRMIDFYTGTPLQTNINIK